MVDKEYFNVARQEAEQQYANASGRRYRRQSGDEKSSGKTLAQLYNADNMNDLVGFIVLTGASAFVGSKIAKDKQKGAIIGGVGYVVAVFLYMKLKSKK
jgi:hypothetical protein